MNLKKYACYVLCFVFLINVPLLAASTTTGGGNRFSFTIEDFSHVSSIELYSDKIAGEKAQFYFNLPAVWKDNFITADREKSINDPVILEQINFYCAAMSGLYKRQLLCSLYVMDRLKWNETPQYQTVLNSKDYVFVVKYGTNGFELPGDRNIYASKFDPVATVSRIKDFIQLPPGQEDEYEFTAFIDGKPMENSVEMSSDGALYVNLREVCETLGYKISWVKSTSSVVVSKGQFVDMFAVSPGEFSDHRGIKMRIINDRTYVSAIYFFRILGHSIDNDKLRNIYIYTK